MLELYDQSLTNKIRSFIPQNSPIEVVSPNSTNDMIIRIKEGSVSFPVIFIRPGNFEFKDGQRNFTSSQYGKFVRKTEEGKLLYLQSDAIKLVYSIGVLATSSADSAGLIREILYKIRTSPKLTITIPFGLDRQYNFSVHQIGNIEFTHSRESFMEAGILYTASLPFEINGAQLFQVREDFPQHINPVLELD